MSIHSTLLRWLKRIGLGLLALIVGITIIGTLIEAVARRHARENYPPRGQMVDIGGRKMHLDCRGEGSPTVIFESGLDFNGSMAWEKVQDPIAKLTRACSYDRAGVMWSEPKDGPQDADRVADDLHATLQGAGIEGPLVMVCHSLGGPYIMDYTRKHPQEVKGLVFVDCTHPDYFAKLPSKAHREVPWFFKAANALAWTGIMRLVPGENVPGMPERIKPIGKAYFGETFGGSLKEMEGLRATFRESGALRELGDRPLVVLTAMQPFSKEALAQMQMTAKEAREMQDQLALLSKDEASWSKRSRQQNVPDAQHYIQFDRPDVVIQAITEVIEAVRANESASASGEPAPK